jgi:hypothetical protein
MGELPNSKDKALEALDFIINVLKQHEQTLDKSISDLAEATEGIAGSGAVKDKISKLDEKMVLLQKQVAALASYLAAAPKAPSPAVAAVSIQTGPKLVPQCTQWTDFQAQAIHAQTVTFTLKETGQLEACALKGNQMFTYLGVPPSLAATLKVWMCRQLAVSESCVFEGSLSKRL